MSVRELGANVVAGSFDIGVQAGSQGTVNVNGGTLNVEGDLTVGDGGSGALTASGGATITKRRHVSWKLFGRDWNGHPLTGSAHDFLNGLLKWLGKIFNDAGLNIGVNGYPGILFLTIANGAVSSVSAPAAYIKIAQYGGSTGTVTVTGNGSTLNSAGGLASGWR